MNDASAIRPGPRAGACKQGACKQIAAHLGLLLAVTATVYFTNLGAAKLWDRDEPRNAGCAREMLERNDWVTPYFNGRLRTHKPVLTYWLMMAAYGVFGVNEFAARFWSAALGIGTTLATYVIARRLFSPQVGLWAGLAMGTSLMFCIASRAATPDAGLIFCTTMAILVYVVGTFRPKAHDGAHAPPQTWAPGRLFPSWPMAALMYAWMGLGVLAKGPVGLVLPTAVIGMFLLLMRLPDGAKAQAAPPRGVWTKWHTGLIIVLIGGLLLLDRTIGPLKSFALLAAAVIGYGLLHPQSVCRRLVRPFAPRHFLQTCWYMRPLTAIAVALAVAAPWYVWVGLRTDGQWLEGFFLKHNLGRATQTFEGHDGTFLFYPVAALAGFFPWSILLISAIVMLVKRLRSRDAWMIGYLFAACWIGVYVGVFSLAKTKLPSYITPAYPALAMMVAAFIVEWTRNADLIGKWTPRLAFGSMAAVGVVLAIALPVAARQFLPGEMWLGVVAVIPLAGAVCGFVFAQRRRPQWSAGSIAACAVLLLTTAFGFVGPRISRHQPITRVLQKIEASSANPTLACHMSREPSWIFYSGQTIQVIGNRRPAEVARFLQTPDAFVLTNDRALPRLEPLLPPDVQPIAREPFFLKKYDLVVLGRTREAVQVARRRQRESQTPGEVAGETRVR